MQEASAQGLALPPVTISQSEHSMGPSASIPAPWSKDCLCPLFVACGACGGVRTGSQGHTGCGAREGPPRHRHLGWGHRCHLVSIEAKGLTFVNNLFFFHKLKQHSDLILTPVSLCIFLSRRGSRTASSPHPNAKVCGPRSE